MKNTVKSNFSLRKLILTALVAGPVAILPAPLWALPSTAATNLTTSSGVSVVTAGTALNVTSPDKGILTWVNFGGGGEAIASTDTLNYILPSSSASVLNLVTGGNTTTINGTVVSNGNVYILNKAGIVIGSGASINAGGFYASSIDEPLAASYFAANGSLTFTGTNSASVTVSHTDAAKTAPVIQALGTGNNIVLAGGATGAAVDVQMGSFFGNLTTRSTGGTIALTAGGAVSVSGNLTVTSNGGAVDLSKGGTAPASFTTSLTGDAVTGTGSFVAGSNIGYAPSTTVNITFAAPTVALVNGATTYNQPIGTAATGYYSTDSTGKITGVTVLTGGSGYTSAPAYTFSFPSANTLTVGGNLSVNTSGGAVGGALASHTSARVTVTGTTSLITNGSTSSGSVTLRNVDFSTLNLTNVGTTSVTDAVGGLTLGNGTINAGGALNATELTISASATSSSTISMASGAKIAVVPSATNTNPKISLSSTSSGVTYTGTGTMTFASLSTSTTATATIAGDKDISLATVGSKGLSVTTSGGSISLAGISRTDATLKLATTGLGDISYTSNSLYTTGSVDLQASNGKVTVGDATSTLAIAVGGSSIFKATNGDVTINPALAATSGVTIQSTTGQVTLGNAFSGNGTISAATNVVLGAPTAAAAADISGGTLVLSGLGAANGTLANTAGGSYLTYTLPTGQKLGAGYTPGGLYDLTIVASPAGAAATAQGYATADSNGRISSVTITNAGSGYTTVSTSSANFNVATAGLNAPSNSVVANGALAISAGSGAITLAGPIVSTSTSELSLSSAQTLNINTNVTAPTLKLTSTGSNISQTAGTIVSTSKATIAAATNATLDTASNNFNQIVVTGTPAGATISDLNGVVIGGGTDAKGDLIVKAGQATPSTAVTIAGPKTTYSTAVSITDGANNLLQATTNPSAGALLSVAAVSTNNLTGFTPGQTVNLNFTAPPSATNAPTITSISTAASTSSATTGFTVVNSTLRNVVLQYPLGSGYLPGSRVTVTFGQQGVPAAYTTAPEAYATVGSNGTITSVTVTNAGAGVVAANLKLDFQAPNAGTIGAAEGYGVADASGKLTSLVITNQGNGYFGSIAPVVTITSAPGGTAATAVATTTAGTTVNVTAAGTNYSAAPTVTMANGNSATATLTAGAVTAITPTNTGTISLGSASTDSIKVAGNLTLSSGSTTGTATTGSVASSTGAYDNALVKTVANSITVTGTISATNNGAEVTFGNAAPIGTTTAYSFGGVGASIGAGNLIVNSNGSVALAATTANSLTAKTLTGDITNTGALTLAGGATLTAKDIFAPGNITLNNAGNAIGGTIVVANAKDFSLTNTVNTTVQAGSAVLVGSAMTGTTSVTTSAGKNITLNTAGGGDFNVVSFNAGGNVTVTDPNGVTIRNASNTGSGTVSITAAGPINLDSGITLASSGGSTFTATGATGTIVDTAAGISVYGPATFSSSNNISISKAGHSFGPVSLSSGVGGAAATTADIVYTESGTANLAGVSVTNAALAPSVTITSTNGAIVQSAGNISLTGVALATTQAATFTAAQGVSLTRTTNSFGGATAIPVTLTAGADSAITANSALVLGNTRVNGGTFTVDTTNSVAAAGAVSQATGSVASIYGNTSITTKGSAITLTNSGNNFGALTLASNSGAAAGADIAVTEGSTLNVNSANAGTGGKVTLTSENANIIQTATGTGITGGTAGTAAVSLTAAKGSITLGGTNNFGGAPITVSTTGSATLVDANATATKLAAGTTVGGSTTIKNTSGSATLSDVSGNILLTGAVFLDMTGALTGTGNIAIIGSGNSFGALQFRAATVTIAEDKTLNIAAGSLATGNATLSSLADVITSGAGSSIFSGSLSLSAAGNITITNPIAIANGLTFRALGAVDLSALSMANLNGKTPTNLGAASYKAPQP